MRAADNVRGEDVPNWKLVEQAVRGIDPRRIPRVEPCTTSRRSASEGA